jgi:large subunit ribosomal protein L3
MPGRMGNGRATVKGLKVIGVDASKNIIMIAGAVPGKKGNLVEIRKK